MPGIHHTELTIRILRPIRPNLTTALSDGRAVPSLTRPTSRGKIQALSSPDRPELAIDDDPPPRHVVAVDRQSPDRRNPGT
jgi:hypothetical protein